MTTCPSPADLALIGSGTHDGSCLPGLDAVNACGERYDSAENPRLRNRLSLAGGTPKAIGHTIIRDLEGL